MQQQFHLWKKSCSADSRYGTASSVLQNTAGPSEPDSGIALRKTYWKTFRELILEYTRIFRNRSGHGRYVYA